MKKIILSSSIALFSFVSIAQAPAKKAPIKKAAPTTVVLKNQLDSVSYLVGKALAENVFQAIPNGNKEIIIKGFTDRLKENPSLCVDPQNQILNAYFQKLEEAKKAEVAKEGMKTREAGIVFLNNNKTKPNIQTTTSGLQYQVVVMGTGEKPKATDQVTVHYHGTTIDGKVFDSSIEKGQPISFPLNGVIAGWTEGLQLMPLGSKFIFYIPQELAYGEQERSELIKPYSVLIFEVELIKIN